MTTNRSHSMETPGLFSISGTEMACSGRADGHTRNCLKLWKGNCSGFRGSGSEDSPSVPNPEFLEWGWRTAVPSYPFRSGSRSGTELGYMYHRANQWSALALIYVYHSYMIYYMLHCCTALQSWAYVLLLTDADKKPQTLYAMRYIYLTGTNSMFEFNKC